MELLKKNKEKNQKMFAITYLTNKMNKPQNKHLCFGTDLVYTVYPFHLNTSLSQK